MCACSGPSLVVCSGCFCGTGSHLQALLHNSSWITSPVSASPGLWPAHPQQLSWWSVRGSWGQPLACPTRCQAPCETQQKTKRNISVGSTCRRELATRYAASDAFGKGPARQRLQHQRLEPCAWTPTCYRQCAARGFCAWGFVHRPQHPGSLGFRGQSRWALWYHRGTVWRSRAVCLSVCHRLTVGAPALSPCQQRASACSKALLVFSVSGAHHRSSGTQSIALPRSVTEIMMEKRARNDTQGVV